MRRSLKDLEPIVVEAHEELVADQPRRHGVEDLAQGEGAGRGDRDARFLEVGRLARRQLLQLGAFEIDARGVAGVAPTDELVDELSPGGKIVEVARAAQQQLVFERGFDMAVGAFDRAVFMGDAGLLRVGVMP